MTFRSYITCLKDIRCQVLFSPLLLLLYVLGTNDGDVCFADVDNFVVVAAAVVVVVVLDFDTADSHCCGCCSQYDVISAGPRHLSNSLSGTIAHSHAIVDENI